MIKPVKPKQLTTLIIAVVLGCAVIFAAGWIVSLIPRRDQPFVSIATPLVIGILALIERKRSRNESI